MPSSDDGVPAPTASVLIVGAGPAGLFAACELLRHGVRPRVVERRAGPHHEARGTAIQPPVLEMLERAGLAEAFLGAGVRIRGVHLLGPGLRVLGSLDFGGNGSAYGFQCSLPQWRTESILREHLQRQGLEVEFGTEVLSIQDDPEGVLVTLAAGGRTETVRARYLLGAGGGHSVTRHSMDGHLAGETYSGRYFVADATLALPPVPEHGRVIIGPTGFVLTSPLPDGRWLIFVNRDDADTSSEPPGERELAALVDRRVGQAAGLGSLQWVSPFNMHRRAVERLGDGKRFLLGDAAHLTSPLGGEGLNLALMDAADIAWKLALVVRGAAKPSLLDSYVAERAAADRHALEVTDEQHRSLMQLIEMCAAGTPEVPEAGPAENLAAMRKRLMFDVSYAGSALVGPAGPGGASPPGERFPGRLGLRGTGHHLVVPGGTPGLDRFRARWDGLVSVLNEGEDGGAVLVRPDGFVGFRADSADGAAIALIDAHLATYLVPGTA